MRFRLFLLILLISFVNALYEDQIGNFDWRQKYIGKVKFAAFDPSSPDRAIVATEENVLAALSMKAGDILWRRIGETDKSRGDIKFLYVNRDPRKVMSRHEDADPFALITVSGHSPAFLRGWDINTGNLVWEWALNSVTENSDGVYFYQDSYIHHVIPVWGSHLEVTEYHASTGQPKSSKSSRINAGWISKDKCVFTSNYFTCLVKDQLLILDILAEGNSVRTKSIQESTNSLKSVKGVEGFVQVGHQVISLKTLETLSEIKTQVNNVFMDEILFQISQNGKELRITSDNQVHSVTTDVPETLDNHLETIACKCKPKKDAANQLVCRFLLSTNDGAITLVQQDKIKWIREEALTQIVAVEFLDLSLSDAQGAIEEELNQKDADVVSSLYRRLHSQYGMIKNLILHVFGLGQPPSFSQRAGLVRDDFGLHKMMVIMTKSGKLFGIDNVNGKQFWTRILKEFQSFENDQNVKIVVQRTSKYYPLSAQCAIIAREKTSGNGILYQFNPISGQPVNGDGITKLNYKIQQAALMHKSGENFLKGILFIDDKNYAHVIPESSLHIADKFFFYIVNKHNGVINGYQIHVKDNNAATTLPIWTLRLGGTDNGQKITQVVSKNAIERVHSQGRVLADRSVMYKYINPNLIAVVTEGPDNVHKYILNVYLIDVVSGDVVFSVNHRRSKGPVNIVHSENWLVYSFFSEKNRRYEITSIELYEGKTQSNSTVWSSLNSPPSPLVERQTFIISGGVAAMKETITEKGITNKHVLIGMHSGAVVEMAWILLDPRRHSLISPDKQREEGIVPYIPELPLQHEMTINYNQSVANIRGIHTSPSGLESTCLVLVYGLDLFVTRVSPSKTFDLLKEDFDYFLISIVLVGLTTATYVVKHLAAKKAIKQAWK